MGSPCSVISGMADRVGNEVASAAPETTRRGGRVGRRTPFRQISSVDGVVYACADERIMFTVANVDFPGHAVKTLGSTALAKNGGSHLTGE